MIVPTIVVTGGFVGAQCTDEVLEFPFGGDEHEQRWTVLADAPLLTPLWDHAACVVGADVSW